MLFKTGFAGYSVKFSSFEDGRLAVATSQNFGIIGNGQQLVIQVTSAATTNCACGIEGSYRTHQCTLWSVHRLHTTGKRDSC